MKRGLSRAKDWVEGFLLCLGVGLMYLGADASDKGLTWWAVGFAVLSLTTFCIYFLLVRNRANEMREM